MMKTLREIAEERQPVGQGNASLKNFLKNYKPITSGTEEPEGFLSRLSGVADFLGSSSKVGIARAIEDYSKIIENGLRPENMTPSQWESVYRWHDTHKAVENWAENVAKENTRQYDRETEPFKYYGSMILQSLPETVVDMGAGIAAGALLEGPVGAAAGGARALISAGKAGRNFLNAYNGASKAAQIARRITPNANTVAATAVGSHLESLGEKQRAIDEYIQDAINKGTYVKDKTEMEAEAIGDKVYRDNMFIISGSNAAEYNMMFGRHGKGMWNRLGRVLASAGTEGAEETGQELATLLELDKPIDVDRLLDAGITGAAMGGMFNVGGQAIHYGAERRQEQQEKEIQKLLDEIRKKKEKELQDWRNSQQNAAGNQPTSSDSNNNISAPQQNSSSGNPNLRNWAHKITGGQMSDEVYNKIIASADKHGVDRKLALALATAENNGLQEPVSDAGAIGVMQLMPETAKALGVDPYNIDQNIDGGIRFLKQQLDAFGGDWRKAAAAYNAGPGAVQKYGGIPPYGETQAYVKKIGGFLNSAPSGDVQGQTQAQPQKPPQQNQRQNNNAILGVQDYNMPVAQMESSVERLKPGWKEIMPQIGGVLKYKFGYDPMVTSAARTREHQMRINPSSPNSWHIIRDNGGDAIDISVRDGQLSAQQEEELLNYFKGTGLFKEVLYHAVVGGKHLHLGGLQTQNLGNMQQQQQNNAQSYDPNSSEIENKMWQLAHRASERAKQYNIDLSPEMVYRQWWQETGFKSRLFREVNNIGGLKTNGKVTSSPAPDGGYYREFGNLEEAVDAYVDEFIKHRPEISGINDVDTYAQTMYDTGYYHEYGNKTKEQAISEYKAGMRGAKVPNAQYNTGGTSQASSNQYQNQSQQVNYQEENQKPLFDLNAEDKNDAGTKDLYSKFVEMFTNSTQGQKAAEVQDFFSPQNGMTNRRGQFINTPENRARIREEYPEELTEFANSYLSNQQAPSTTSTSSMNASQVTQTINNTPKARQASQTPKIETETPNLDRIRENERTQAQAQSNRENINPQVVNQNQNTEKEKTTQQSTPAELREKAAVEDIDQKPKEFSNEVKPVDFNAKQEKSERPKTVETKPFENTFDEEVKPIENKASVKAIEVASAPVSEDLKERKRQAKAIKTVAEANNIEIPAKVALSLPEGGAKAIEKSQEILRDNGALPPARNEARITTDSGKEYKSKYKVVDIDNIVTSDNGAYPQELQPRDRNRKSLELQVEQMAQNLRPQDLLDSRNINQGAPVIRNDGVVVNGNGRTMAIRKAYDNNSADEYRQALIDNAERLGINANEVSRMQRPILVRSLDNVADEDLADLTQSTTGGSRMGASEQAQIDAEKISSEALSKYIQNDNGDFTTAANRDFVGSVLSKISNQNDLNAYTDKDGNVNADGVNRVKRAIFAKAYGDEKLVSKMSESTDDNVRNVSTGLMNAAPNMAQVQIGMDKGNLHKYNIAKNITDAVQKLSALREQGKPVSSYLNEQSMFDEAQDTDEMRDILSFLDNNKRSGKKISAFFNKIADLVKAQGDPKQEQLFAGKPLTEREIIKRAKNAVEERGNQNLFEESEENQNKSETKQEQARRVLAVAEEEEKEQKAENEKLFNQYEKELEEVKGLSGQERQTEELVEENNSESAQSEEKGKEKSDLPEDVSHYRELTEQEVDERARALLRGALKVDTPEKLQALQSAAKKNSYGDSITIYRTTAHIDVYAPITESKKLSQNITKMAEKINGEKIDPKDSRELEYRFKGDYDMNDAKVFARALSIIFSDGKKAVKMDKPMTQAEREELEKISEKRKDKYVKSVREPLVKGKLRDGGEVKIEAGEDVYIWFDKYGFYRDTDDVYLDDIDAEEARSAALANFYEYGSTENAIRAVQNHMDRYRLNWNPEAPLSDFEKQEIDILEKESPNWKVIEESTIEAEDEIESDSEMESEKVKSPKKHKREKAKAAQAKWTDERLDEVVKNNPDLKNVVEQFNGTTFGGHVHFKKSKDRKNFIKHLENLENPDFKLSIAYTGSATDFSEFSLKYVGSGTGMQLHGHGLYFAKLKNTAKGYKGKNGKLFKADIPSEKEMLEERANFVNQPVSIKKKLKDVLENLNLEQREKFFKKYQNRLFPEIRNKETNLVGELEQLQSVVEKFHSASFKGLMNKRLDRLSKTTGLLTAKDIEYLKESPENAELISKQIAETIKAAKQKNSSVNESRDTEKEKQRQEKIEKYSKDTFAFVSENGTISGKEIYEGLTTAFENSAEKASQYLNKHGIKGIAYNNGSEGRCYVVFDDKAIKILEKWSKQGRGKVTVENFVDPKDLSEAQKGIAAWGDEIGVPVVYFKGSEELNGAHANGITYINVDSKVNPRWIFWHESGHWLKAQHPELISDIIEKLGISKRQIDDFRERTKRYDLTDDEVREEIFADNMFDADKRLDILQTLGKKDASLLDRLVSWLKSIMDKFTSYFNTPKYGLTNTQKNQMFAELGKALRQIKESNGKPRYRYGNTTHVVQYADGRELPKPSMRYSDKGAFNFGEIKEARDKYEGTKEWLKAPNGERTNLTEKQWLLVRTKAFKNWFGDWENDPKNASKVVDENGEPLVVYHGSEADFTVFDSSKSRANMDIQGNFFSPWEDDAQGYGRNVRAFFLNIRKPADSGKGYKALNQYKGQNGAGIKAREHLIKQGFDGVNNDDEEYITFAPNQIKSATDNVGTFDKDDPDIRFSLSETKKGKWLTNPYQARKDAEKIIDALRKETFTNKATGIRATISKKGGGKLISDKAVEKSINNGYDEIQHIEAAKNIKQLFEDAELVETRDDRNNEQDVVSIKYFHCDTEVLGDKAVARMMAKETIEHGHKLYTIELQQLNKPTGLSNRNGTNSPVSSKGSTRNSHIADSRDAEEPSSENISQNEAEGKTEIKYSIGNSSNSEDNSGIINSFRHPLDTLAKKFHLKGDKIITDEDEKARKREEMNKVIEAYLKNPTDKEVKKRKKELGINNDMIAAYANGEEYVNDINLKQYWFGSASRIADKVAAFRAFFRIGKKATEKVISLRDSFNRDYGAVMDLVKSKEDKKALFDLLLVGDREGKEYGNLTDEEKAGKTGKDYTNARIDKIVEEAGVKRNVAEAYIGVRRMLNRMYNLIDDARRKPKHEAKWLSEDDIKKLKNNKFVEILKEYDAKDEKGQRLVAWKEYANHKQTYSNITQEMYDKFKNDDAIQILQSKEVKGANGETLYNIETREALPALNKLTGYLPHFFHEFMVRVRDKDGKTAKTIGSGRTQREAIKIAEEWLKNNKLEAGQEITALPKVFNFEALGMKEEDFAPIMGDKDFFKMLNKIAKNNELTISEAKQLVDGSVKLKNRHRFLGNTLHRKGVEGYSDDVEWILRHFFNQGSRYAALETEFKPQAISLFERMYGSFDKDWSGNKLAQYTKDFINDVNGTPTHLETMINEALNKSSIFKNFVTPMFGDRAALTLATNITSKVGVLKLGVWNVSSAFLNYTQLLNAGGYLGGYVRLLKHAARIAKSRYKPSYKELRMLAETGVLTDIGMDTATGYDKNRNYDNDVSGIRDRIGRMLSYVCGNRSMYLFRAADMHCRIATTFAAYEKAISEGKSEREAIAYARDINVKANFDYSVVDSPNILRRASIFGKIIGQFQKYPIKQVELMADFVPWSKKTNREQKIAFWAPYLLACGLGGIPAFNWLDELFKKFGINLKDGIQEWIMQNFKDNAVARTVGKVIMYGSGAIANVDFSTRAGLGDIRLPSLGGPLWNTIEGVATNTAKGEYMDALRSFSPGMYNFVAFCEGETFEKRGRKKDILDPYDRVTRLLGFKSVDESLDTDMKRIRNNARTERNEERREVLDRLIENPYDKEAQKRAKELGITGKEVKEERNKKRTTRRERFESSMTKRERKNKEFDYMLEFAK